MKQGAGFGSGFDFALIERPLTESIAAASLPRTKAMLDVFRFAWFAVRTFFGAIALILVVYAGMWVFVKIHSAASRNADPDAALRRVMSYNAQAVGHENRKDCCGSNRQREGLQGTALPTMH